MSDLSNSTRFTVGEWTVEPSLDRIRRPGEDVVLEPRIMALLAHLASHAGETLSTDALADQVWSGRAISDQPVYQGIAQLRKALGDDARSPRYIVTIPKKGYRLVAAVGIDAPGSVSRVRAEHRPRFLTPALSLFIAGSYLFLSSSDVSVSLDRSGAAGGFDSIAVLPFVDLSDDRDQQHVGDGIAEGLIHRIALTPGIRVVARTSSFALHGTNADIREIGKRLGADAVLEGSIRSAGDRLRVTAQLVDSSSGFRIWSEVYEPLLAEEFSVQDRIAASVTEILRPDSGDAAPARRPWTQSREAAEAYYLGMFQMHKRRAGSLDRAIEHFEDALRHDPGFALAHAGLAKTYFLAADVRFGRIPVAEASTAAQAAIETARSLDGSLPEVLEILAGAVTDTGNFAEAETLIRLAISNNPNYAPAYKVYGHLLTDIDRRSAAEAAFRTAVDLDPLSPVLRVNLALALAGMNRRAEAGAEFLTAIELDPGWHVPYAKYARNLPAGQYAKAIELGRTAYSIEGPEARFAGDAAMLVAYSFLDLEDFAEANEWYEKAMERDIDEWRLANERLHWLIAQDRYDEADALLTQWEKSQTKHMEVYRYGGLYRAILGQDAAAIGMLEQAAAMSGEAGITSLYRDSEPRWGYMPEVTLADLYMRSGSRDKAAGLLDAAEQRLEMTEARAPGMAGAIYVRAAIEATRGNGGAALNLLRRCADGGWTRAWFLERDPVFARFRRDARFEAILDGMRRHLAAERRAVADSAGTMGVLSEDRDGARQRRTNADPAPVGENAGFVVAATG